MRKSQPLEAHQLAQSLLNDLRKIYVSKIRPLEVRHKFDKFYAAPISDAEWSAKPMVLLLGGYSSGKTSFVHSLLGKDYPGMRISPEPTTDRFTVIEYGPEVCTFPGNALSVMASKPFQALSAFGNSFLNRLVGVELPAPILESLTFIDTPGVLSGEKQAQGRGYDFVRVVDWFAAKSDIIILLFDVNKLDISDEFKAVISTLWDKHDKVRILLNKADSISAQQLMRVYGALMWQLGRVLPTPEVPRVYMGSFWNEPLRCTDSRLLFEKEKSDLMLDLLSLPENTLYRKVNETVKRARLIRVHALIMGHLRKQMPILFGKSDKQAKLIANMEGEFATLSSMHNIPKGDFPNVHAFKEVVKVFNFSDLESSSTSMIRDMERALSHDIPVILAQFPREHLSVEAAGLRAQLQLNVDDFSATSYDVMSTQEAKAAPATDFDPHPNGAPPGAPNQGYPQPTHAHPNGAPAGPPHQGYPHPPETQPHWYPPPGNVGYPQPPHPPTALPGPLQGQGHQDHSQGYHPQHQGYPHYQQGYPPPHEQGYAPPQCEPGYPQQQQQHQSYPQQHSHRGQGYPPPGHAQASEGYYRGEGAPTPARHSHHYAPPAYPGGGPGEAHASQMEARVYYSPEHERPTPDGPIQQAGKALPTPPGK